MLLADADTVAARICDLLRPHCDRIEVAGSVRRRKPQVGDIEVVCIPKTYDEPLLFGRSAVRSPAFVHDVCGIGLITKGHPTGKYIQIWIDEPGVQIDLFTATPENWGLILAIRIGSADFSHHVLACGWVRAGFRSFEGMLHTRRGVQFPVREEEDLFRLIGIPWVKPEDRT